MTTLCTPNTRDGVCGLGVCLPTGASCACDDGVVFDTSDVLYPTCVLTTPTAQAMHATIGVSAALVGGWAAWELVRVDPDPERKAKGAKALRGKARLIALGVLGGMVCLAALALAHALEEYHGWATSVCWTGVLFFLGGVSTAETSGFCSRPTSCS